MVAAAIPLAGAGMVLSAMAQAVQSLYGMGSDINDWLNKHIEDMKGSENATISRTGRVLEGAKFGFGIGYITPVVIISVGQLLLGNPFAAVTTIATAAIATNPIAMTCGAIGAIYYGWDVLNDAERDEILTKLSEGLEVGIELIKSIIGYVIGRIKEFTDSQFFKEMRRYIAEEAKIFGKTLGDVTHRITDVVVDTVDTFRRKSGEVATKTGELAGEIAVKGGEAIDKTAEVAIQTYETVKGAGGQAVDATLKSLGKRKSYRQSKKPTKKIKQPL